MSMGCTMKTRSDRDVRFIEKCADFRWRMFFEGARHHADMVASGIGEDLQRIAVPGKNAEELPSRFPLPSPEGIYSRRLDPLQREIQSDNTERIVRRARPTRGAPTGRSRSSAARRNSIRGRDSRPGGGTAPSSRHTRIPASETPWRHCQDRPFVSPFRASPFLKLERRSPRRRRRSRRRRWGRVHRGPGPCASSRR